MKWLKERYRIPELKGRRSKSDVERKGDNWLRDLDYERIESGCLQDKGDRLYRRTGDMGTDRSRKNKKSTVEVVVGESPKGARSLDFVQDRRGGLRVTPD